MSGTSQGSKKVAAKLLAKNPNHYKELGKIGGQNGRGLHYNGGFRANPDLARIAGAKGGKISRRKKIA